MKLTIIILHLTLIFSQLTDQLVTCGEEQSERYYRRIFRQNLF